MLFQCELEKALKRLQLVRGNYILTYFLFYLYVCMHPREQKISNFIISGAQIMDPCFVRSVRKNFALTWLWELLLLNSEVLCPCLGLILLFTPVIFRISCLVYTVQIKMRTYCMLIQSNPLKTIKTEVPPTLTARENTSGLVFHHLGTTRTRVIVGIQHGFIWLWKIFTAFLLHSKNATVC